MTDKYDPANAEHVKTKKMIEYGNSLCELRTTAEIDKAIDEAGFIKEETIDLVNTNLGNDEPWYSTLQKGWSFSQFRHTKIFRDTTQYILRAMKFLRLVPNGTSGAHRILLVAADSLPAGGELGIFTPMYLVVVSKKNSNHSLKTV